MQESIAELTEQSLKQVARHRPATDMTIYPNGHNPNPLLLLEAIRRLEEQTPKDVRILRRRIKRRSI